MKAKMFSRDDVSTLFAKWQIDSEKNAKTIRKICF